MSLIQVDTDKCKRDGICASVCPAKLIKLEGEGFPEETADAEKWCIACGHCVAACPKEALSNSRVTGCLPYDKAKQVSADALVQFLKMRRSVREFKSSPVPREVLMRVIDAARWAPSAGNLQRARWLAVEKPETLRKISSLVADVFRPSPVIYVKRVAEAWDQGIDAILHNAPHAVIAYASAEDGWSPTDCAIALTYLELAAKAEGLGACWCGFLVEAAAQDGRIAECLGIPPGHRIFGASMIGYPKFKYHRIPERNPAVIDWR